MFHRTPAIWCCLTLCVGCAPPASELPLADSAVADSAVAAEAPPSPPQPPADASVRATDVSADVALAPDVAMAVDAADVTVVLDTPPTDAAPAMNVSASADAPRATDVVPPADAPPSSLRIGTTATWHIDLEAPVDTTVRADWFDIDLFDNSESVIRAIHARGAHVVCYFSAGSGEDWRPDYASLPRAGLGSGLDGWPGERWLDIRNTAVRAVMAARMDLAVRKGCDGVDPDNVDGYANSTGFPLSASDQLSYNRFLAASAHSRHLVVGLKNDVDQISSLVGDFDFAINEQCFMYNECAAVAAFTRASKSVLQIEYGTVSPLLRSVCPGAAGYHFFTILPGADRLSGTYTRCP